MLQRSLCEGKLFNSVCKTELIRVIKLGLFLKQGGKVNYFCLKQLQQGLKAFAAHLYPYFPWVFLPFEVGRRGVTPTDLHLQNSPRELQRLHACKLRAIWRIYAQNAREKQACKIRQSLSYTQYSCICHREISSPLLLHTSCVYFLKADLKEVVKCWSIIVSSHSNFSMNCMYWSVCLKVDYSK